MKVLDREVIARLESLTCKNGCKPCDKCQVLFEAIEIVAGAK